MSNALTLPGTYSTLRFTADMLPDFWVIEERCYEPPPSIVPMLGERKPSMAEPVCYRVRAMVECDRPAHTMILAEYPDRPQIMRHFVHDRTLGLYTEQTLYMPWSTPRTRLADLPLSFTAASVGELYPVCGRVLNGPSLETPTRQDLMDAHDQHGFLSINRRRTICPVRVDPSGALHPSVIETHFIQHPTHNWAFQIDEVAQTPFGPITVTRQFMSDEGLFAQLGSGILDPIQDQPMGDWRMTAVTRDSDPDGAVGDVSYVLHALPHLPSQISALRIHAHMMRCAVG